MIPLSLVALFALQWVAIEWAPLARLLQAALLGRAPAGLSRSTGVASI